MRTRLVTLVIALSFLAACGGEGSADSNGPDGSGSDVPACADVKVIDEDFEGCEEDGSIQAAVIYDCEDGSKLVAAGSVFGKVGEEATHVPDAADSQEYSAMWDECKGL